MKFKPSEAPPGWYKTKTQAKLEWEAAHPVNAAFEKPLKSVGRKLEEFGGAVAATAAGSALKAAVRRYGVEAVVGAGATASVAVAGTLLGYYLGKQLMAAAASDTWDMRRSKVSLAIAQARNAYQAKMGGRPLTPDELKIFSDRRKRELDEIDRMERISHTGGLATYGKVG